MAAAIVERTTRRSQPVPTSGDARSARRQFAARGQSRSRAMMQTVDRPRTTQTGSCRRTSAVADQATIDRASWMPVSHAAAPVACERNEPSARTAPLAQRPAPDLGSSRSTVHRARRRRHRPCPTEDARVAVRSRAIDCDVAIRRRERPRQARCSSAALRSSFDLVEAAGHRATGAHYVATPVAVRRDASSLVRRDTGQAARYHRRDASTAWPSRRGTIPQALPDGIGPCSAVRGGYG